MRATTGTNNLRANPIRVRNPPHSTRDLIVKTRPPTPSIELVFRTVQRHITAFAHVCALFPKIVVLAAERRLCPLVKDDCFLFSSQLALLDLLHLFPPARLHSSADFPAQLIRQSKLPLCPQISLVAFGRSEKGSISLNKYENCDWFVAFLQGKASNV